MFWIHGGCDLGGAGSEEYCDGTNLALNGTTVVTFNYRLGAFRYLARSRLGYNFVFLDQRMALTWLSKNITAFGGDINKITIFGEPAGAITVRALLSCPAAHGLFHRAVLQSAGFEEPAWAQPCLYERARKVTEALFEILDSEDPDELREKPTSAVQNASHGLSGIPPKPGQMRTPADLV